MSDKAILVDRKVVPAELMEWAEWMETNKYRSRATSGRSYSAPEEDPTRVAHDRIGDSDISTVFLGLNHSFGMGPDLWFETMVFGGELDGEQDRYTTWDEAVAGHAEMVSRVRNTASSTSGEVTDGTR